MNPAPTERKPGPGRPQRGRPGGWLDRLAKGLLAAVVVSRLLTPTDAAAAGETLWIAQFTLLALVVWSVAVYRAGIVRLQFDWVDGAVLLLCLGHVAGALVVIGTSGDKRAAASMLWEWCAVAATFFLMRRLLDTPA